MTKITKRTLDALRPDPAARDLFVWDGELRGFGVRMKPSAHNLLVQYRTSHARTRRSGLGRGRNAHAGRGAAKGGRELLAEVAGGGDPSQARRERRVALTLAELCRHYQGAARAGLVMTRFRKPKRPSTIINDEGRISRHIVPLLGSVVACELTRAQVQRMANSIAAGKTAGVFKTKPRGKAVVEGGPATAARTVELLGGIWAWAERRGFVSGQSPTRGVEKHKGDAKERFLSPEELDGLGAALRAHDAAQSAAANALRLMALTGARREEICALRWREIDAATGCLRLEETKTGRSMRPLGKEALRLLADLPRGEGEFVFPNADGTGSADLKKRIAAIFDEAGLQDVRAQTLRRTFASVAADEGYGDATIGELLGHARRGVTARHYIRRPDAALLAAADKTAGHIARAMEGNKGGEVVPLRKSGAEAAS